MRKASLETDDFFYNFVGSFLFPFSSESFFKTKSKLRITHIDSFMSFGTYFVRYGVQSFSDLLIII